MSRRLIRAALRHLDPDCTYGVWFRVGAAIHTTLHGHGKDLFDEWSARGMKYAGHADIERQWRYLRKPSNGRPITLGTIRHLVEERGTR